MVVGALPVPRRGDSLGMSVLWLWLCGCACHRAATRSAVARCACSWAQGWRIYGHWSRLLHGPRAWVSCYRWPSRSSLAAAQNALALGTWRLALSHPRKLCGGSVTGHGCGFPHGRWVAWCSYEPAPEADDEIDLRPPLGQQHVDNALPRNVVTEPTG